MTYKDALKTLKEIYSMSPVGGPLHIVVDDYNVEDEMIYWCIYNSIKNEKDAHLQSLCCNLAMYLFKLTEDDRLSFLDAYHSGCSENV